METKTESIEHSVRTEAGNAFRFSASRVPAAAFLCLVFLYYGVVVPSRLVKEGNWDRRIQAQPLDPTRSMDVPGSVQSWIRWSDALREIPFPPQHTAAVGVLSRGLVDHPRSSLLWSRLAYSLYFSGEVEKSRQALERADELDPNFPYQRMESIRLWVLLGEESKSIELGKKLCTLGNQQRGSVIAEFASLGWDLERVFRELNLASVPYESQVPLLDSIASSYGPQSILALSNTLPKGWTRRPDVHSRLLVAALWPLNYDEALRLLDESPSGVTPETAPGSGILAGNLELKEDPFLMLQPIGWQSPKEMDLAHASWIRPTGEDPHGKIRIEYEARTDLKSDWRFYRALVAPGISAHMELEVELVPPDPSEVDLLVQAGETPLRKKVQRRIGGRQVVSLDIPAAEAGQLVIFKLSRTPVGYAPIGVNPALIIHRMVLSPTSGVKP